VQWRAHNRELIPLPLQQLCAAQDCPPTAPAVRSYYRQRQRLCAAEPLSDPPELPSACVATPATCSALCDAAPGCHSFNLSTGRSGGVCALGGRLSGVCQGIAAQAGGLEFYAAAEKSGVGDCPLPSPEREYYEHFYQSACGAEPLDDPPSLPAACKPTVAACSALCDATPGCLSFNITQSVLGAPQGCELGGRLSGHCELDLDREYVAFGQTNLSRELADPRLLEEYTIWPSLRCTPDPAITQALDANCPLSSDCCVATAQDCAAACNELGSCVAFRFFLPDVRGGDCVFDKTGLLRPCQVFGSCVVSEAEGSCQLRLNYSGYSVFDYYERTTQCHAVPASSPTDAAAASPPSNPRASAAASAPILSAATSAAWF